MKTILFLLVLFFANVIQTITGFAGNLLAMPFSISLISYNSARVVINIFTLISCGTIVCKNYKSIRFDILFKSLVVLCIGMLFSFILLNQIDLSILKVVYGILIILIASNKMIFHISIPSNELLNIIIVFIAGIIHELFLSGGALLVVYYSSVLKDKDEFRATIASVWVILDSLLVIEHFFEHLYTSINITYIGLSIIPLILSYFVGKKLYSKVDTKSFMNITYILLLLSGIFILI
ncbi:MAG: sulfite exporter TauE/SafE family protein [Thomasclavelia sp.]|nr:sulfite exporter TauE/SafE family protein [Thomasclavelia sp.]